MDECRHTVLALLVLEELESLEGSGTSDELVGERGLVAFVTVNLLVGVVGVSCKDVLAV